MVAGRERDRGRRIRRDEAGRVCRNQLRWAVADARRALGRAGEVERREHRAPGELAAARRAARDALRWLAELWEADGNRQAAKVARRRSWGVGREG